MPDRPSAAANPNPTAMPMPSRKTARIDPRAMLAGRIRASDTPSVSSSSGIVRLPNIDVVFATHDHGVMPAACIATAAAAA